MQRHATAPANPEKRAIGPLVAWAVTVRAFGENTPGSVVVATTRGRAISRLLAQANGAGYRLKWQDFRAVRSPMHDVLAEKHGHISWTWDHAEDWRWRALAEGRPFEFIDDSPWAHRRFP